MKTLVDTLNESLVKNVGLGRKTYTQRWADEHVSHFNLLTHGAKNWPSWTWHGGTGAYIDDNGMIHNDEPNEHITIDTANIPEGIKFSPVYKFGIVGIKDTLVLNDTNKIPDCIELKMDNVFIKNVTLHQNTFGRYRDYPLVVNFFDCKFQNVQIQFGKVKRSVIFTKSIEDMLSVKSNCEGIILPQSQMENNWLEVCKKYQNNHLTVLDKYVNSKRFPNLKIVKAIPGFVSYTRNKDIWTATFE